MKKLTKTVTALAVLLIVYVGTISYVSLDRFIKPVGFQVIYGYSTAPCDTAVEKIKYTISSIDSCFNSLIYKEMSINFNGLIQRLLGNNCVKDVDESLTVVKLNNGYLTFLNSKADVSLKAKNLINLDKYVKSKKCDFLYVQAPYKISKYDFQLPEGLQDYSNENADALLALLDNGSVDYIDLRTELYNQGVNQYDYYFKTDHHWTPEGAFFAFRTVSDILSKEYGFDLNRLSLDLKNYSINIYEKWFLGSQGKRVGKYYAGVDDVSIITPNFETDFIFSVPYIQLIRSGEFKDTMFDFDQISNKNYFNLNPYAAYTGGDYKESITINNLAPNEKKVLLVRDSYSCVFSPFLSLNCRELRTIDLRHYQDGTLVEYIEDYQPDMVIIMYNAGALSGDSKMFDFS